jgi:outer membrane protein OmpA-like peptidoglycan-associated protein
VHRTGTGPDINTAEGVGAMRNARLWLWGLLPLLLVWVIATWLIQPGIEADLTRRTNEAATAKGEPWASAIIAGRDAELAVTAPANDAKSKALAIFAEVFGVRLVSSKGEVRPPPAPPAPPPGPATQSPYLWSVEKTGAGVTLGGFAPDAATLNQTLAAARGLFAGVPLNDAQALGACQPPVYAKAVQLALAIVSRLEEGKGALRNDTLTLTGKPGSAEAYAALRKLMDDARAAGVMVVDSLTVPAPPPPPPSTQETAPAQVVVRAPDAANANAQECGARVRDAIGGRAVHFETSMRYVREESLPLLRAIAAVLRDCGKVAVSIEGHTDSDGGDRYNQNLSEKRAAEVVKALSAAGAPVAALTSAGFGADKPVAPNSTRDSKAKNRRVEIIIR